MNRIVVVVMGGRVTDVASPEKMQITVVDEDTDEWEDIYLDGVSLKTFLDYREILISGKTKKE